jgi:RNA polymerase sigma-70 factor (ECF subfamily)
MQLEALIKEKEFLQKISASIKNIICANFPHTTSPEREDIEQEVKLKIWKMASGGKKIGNLRSYLWRVVYTTTLDVIGKRINMASLKGWSGGDDQNFIQQLDLVSPESLIEKKELKMMIEKAIDSLSQKRRLVIKLRLAEMSVVEMADFLGWSQNKVTHLLYRGLIDLKEKFGGDRINSKLKQHNLSKKLA